MMMQFGFQLWLRPNLKPDCGYKLGLKTKRDRTLHCKSIFTFFA